MRNNLRRTRWLALRFLILALAVNIQVSTSQAASKIKSVLGDHKLTVVVVTLPNEDALGLTDDRVKEMVAYADGLWSHVSFGQIRLTLDRVITRKKTGNPLANCGVKLAKLVASQIGWKSSPKKHLVAFDRTRTCTQFKGEATQNGSMIFLNSWAEVTDDPEMIANAANSFGRLLAHEFGHNIGLKHVAKGACSLALEIPCSLSKERGKRFDEYGGVDLMGTGNVNFALNPISQLKLGVLGTSAVKEIQLGEKGNELVEIELSSANSESGIRIIKLVSRDKKSVWWVSFDSLPICSGEWKNDVRFKACQTPWREFFPDEFMNQFFNIRDEGVYAVRVHFSDKRLSSVDAVQQFTVDGNSSLTEGETYPLEQGVLLYNFIGDKIRVTLDLTP